MTGSVLFEEIVGQNNQSIGVVCLNREKTLNSLTLEMVSLMLDKFRQWQQNSSIAAVFIYAAGEKAFCAGGDILAFHHSASEQTNGSCDYADAFFQHEYRLDYLLHDFGKPIICWGHGIVMGGGLGVFAGCSHRVVTERSRLAMPEVTIALFPDVGGSYFLNRMPGECGRFLALTGTSINAADSLYVNIADYFIHHEQKCSLLKALTDIAFTGNQAQDSTLINALLNDAQASNITSMPEGNLESHQVLINELCAGDNINAIAERFHALETNGKWMQRAKAGFVVGSPLAIKWIFHQLMLSRNLSLREVFQAEILLATNVIRHPEFSEGTRALLIDKDQNPQWQFKTLADVTDATVADFFKAPWSQNPLADL